MNTQRAIEISESPDMVQVTYQGMPIYIQHVDKDRETARIYPLGNPEEELDVSLAELSEH